jgi:hypothetical protein
VKITYAGTTIVDDSVAIAPGAGWQFVAQQLVGVVTGWKAVNGKPTARGNRQRPFGGSATRAFDTHAAAVEFAGKHEATLPNSGDIVLSVDGTAVLTYADAVLEVVQAPMPTGVSVTVTYTFRLAGPAT